MFYNYLQNENSKENENMELIGSYYSDVLTLSNNKILIYQNNVHKDFDLQVIDMFETMELNNSNKDYTNEIMIGTENDLIYRMSIMDNTACDINIIKDINGKKGDSKALQTVLEHLDISYSISVKDLKAPEVEYDENKYLPTLKEFWGNNATFRDLEFYTNPSMTKEVKAYSQGSLISEIIEQCEKAMKNEKFRDVFITAPTGAGKSLLFQVPALYINNEYNLVTIVISPLIALMNDQVAQLEEERGVDCVTCINSSISFEERQRRIAEIQEGKKSIIYLVSAD